MPELTANNVDLDQTPRSSASDLGLRCLLMSLLRDTRLKWVKSSPYFGAFSKIFAGCA